MKISNSYSSIKNKLLWYFFYSSDNIDNSYNNIVSLMNLPYMSTVILRRTRGSHLDRQLLLNYPSGR